jgi:NADH-quinone oxidoreductase subunit J|uniref:NADH-ubiquinone oxidoreductase chain 6 n=1 Tax=Halamphora coffeiformis TaxID=1487565 RepID=A0A2R4A3B2_9STRA|nr:NADH dehydrogenase subunit 6 [Halamphora coffeaeformis]AVR57538.1 NADH dehydrogenase subunit 6 [Halamphora coffeaeformis]
MLSANVFFYFFSGVLVFSAIMVIVASHSVFSLLFLVLSFIASAFLLFMLECEFLALIFIVVYVGAIAVLFLFAVMMLDAKLQNLTRNISRYLPVGFLFALFFLIPILLQASKEEASSETILSNKNSYANWYDLIDSTLDIEVYGQVLYSYFVLQFLVVGLILLVVLIGVVYLTNTYTSNRMVDQSTYKQLSVTSKFFY